MLNNNSDSYEFTSANKLFTAKELQVRQCLLELFGEELETLVRTYLCNYNLYYTTIRGMNSFGRTMRDNIITQLVAGDNTIDRGS